MAVGAGGHQYKGPKDPSPQRDGPKISAWESTPCSRWPGGNWPYWCGTSMLASLEVGEALPCHKNHILRGEETSTTSWAFSQQGGRAEQALSSGPGEVPGQREHPWVLGVAAGRNHGHMAAIRQNERCPSRPAARIPVSSSPGSGIYFLLLLGQEISQLSLKP